MALYTNRRRADVKRIKPGYKNQLLVAPIAWFASLGEPTGPGSALIPASAQHVFLPGRDFIEFYTAPKKTTAKGVTQGDAGSRFANWTTSAILPGDGPEVQEILNLFLNEELIILLKDANCKGGDYIQFGCDCNPASMEKMDFDGGTTDSGTKGWAVEFSASCRFYYEGGKQSLTPALLTINGAVFAVNGFPFLIN